MTLKALSHVTMVIASLSLSACATQNRDQTPSSSTSLSERFAPQMETHPQTLLLAPHETGLSDRQQQAIAAFVAQWRDNGGGLMTVEAASTGAPGAYETSAQALTALEMAGLEPHQMRLIGYDGGGAIDAPVRIRYDHATVRRSDCAALVGDLGISASNDVPDSFGCALNANMAAQVVNPHDLFGPRTQDPADAGRRLYELDLYRKGAVTSSAKDDQASGAVSKAIP